MALTYAFSLVAATLAGLRARYVPVRIATCGAEPVLERVGRVTIGSLGHMRVQLESELRRGVAGAALHDARVDVLVNEHAHGDVAQAMKRDRMGRARRA